VIMGLSRDPVEAGVGLSFEKIAGEMSFAAAASSLSMEDQAKLKRREFARQYLDKLINIEIPARPTSSAKFENLVLDNAGPKSSAATVRERSLSVLKIVLPVVVSLFVICGLAVAGFQIGRLGQKGSTQEASNTNVQKHISAGNGGAAGSGDAGTNTPAASPAPPTTAVLPSLVPPEQTSNEGFTYVWPLLGTALLLYVCWRVLSRKEEVLVRDSPEFRRALEIWDTLIVNTHSTPRSTKRFMNRVRCLAMRLRPSAEAEPRWRFLWNWPNPETPGSTFPSTSQLPESMLVALSTIYDLAPEAIRNDDLYAKAMQGLLKPLSQGEVGVNAKIESVYEGALKHHQQQFPGKWPPNSEQRKLFLEMVADVTVRG